MIKKIFKTILKVLIFVVIYLFQIYVINNTAFMGVKGNLCLMAVVIVALMDKEYVAYLVAGICGIASDILFSTTIGKYVVIYILIVSILIGLKKMYKSDNKIAIIIFSVLSIVIYEILQLVFSLMIGQAMVNVFSLIFMLIKESVINVGLAFLIYILLKPLNQEG